MAEIEQKRMWAYLPLPCDLTDVGDLQKWMVVTGDPIALLAEVEAFIGYQAGVEDLKDRVREMLEPYEQLEDRQVSQEAPKAHASTVDASHPDGPLESSHGADPDVVPVRATPVDETAARAVFTRTVPDRSDSDAR